MNMAAVRTCEDGNTVGGTGRRFI